MSLSFILAWAACVRSLFVHWFKCVVVLPLFYAYPRHSVSPTCQSTATSSTLSIWIQWKCIFNRSFSFIFYKFSVCRTKRNDDEKWKKQNKKKGEKKTCAAHFTFNRLHFLSERCSTAQAVWNVFRQQIHCSLNGSIISTIFTSYYVLLNKIKYCMSRFMCENVMRPNILTVFRVVSMQS